MGTNIVFLALKDTAALPKLQSFCRLLSPQRSIAGILICIYNSKLGQWVNYREFDVFYFVLCPRRRVSTKVQRTRFFENSFDSKGRSHDFQKWWLADLWC